ncbi:MAG TPA: hypothetical protein PK788_11840 [Gemmatimonadaceae bacterium]|nr:hypothetical protein [Gemmatimonadaceae bacterium]HRQ78872.1 hypothetical protein [Gemmatimonadaceae bacterium]
MRNVHIAVLGVLLLAGTACRDGGPAAPPLDLLELIPVGGTQVVVQETPGPETGTVTYVVRVITRRSDLGAYQGVVRFAPNAFELIESVTPSGGEGEMHLINPEVSAGQIRFAAYATERFASDEAFRFTVRPLVMRADANLRAELTVGGAVSGAALEAEKLLASDGVRDSRGHLIAQ